MTHRDQRGSHRDAPVDPATRMLIVEQDRGISRSLTFMLAVRGYDEVRAVRSGARALAVAAVMRPGIVFLDLDRPGKESLELANQLRRDANRFAMRMIALTTSIEHDLREEARRAGFERYLVKPLSQAELDKVLRLPGQAAA